MKILVVHTGGTIGMVGSVNGFVPATAIVEDTLSTLISSGLVPTRTDIVQLQPLIDSAHSEPLDWMRIATEIFNAASVYDGFVVTHGTDTLAYTASALCLALKGLRKPVIVTGAMMPLSVEDSDGVVNLRDACNAAAHSHPGVWVQFAGKLLHGARVRKSHSSALDAFEANPSVAAPRWPCDTAQLNELLQRKIGIFSVTPGACNELLWYAAGKCDGVLLRCYGSGTAPDTKEFRQGLEHARTREVPVLAVSQCPEGGLRFGTYAAGRSMRETGVIDGRDISAEMAYCKLHFALSLYSDFADQRKFLAKTICGEMSPDVVK